MARSMILAIKGQLHKDEITGTNYVFPKENVDEFSLIDSDPRITMQALGLTGAEKECYSIAVTPNGILYVYRRILPNRGDCAMVLLLAGGPTNDGSRLCEKLADILNYALKEESSSSINDDIIKVKLSGCMDLFDWSKAPNHPIKKEEEEDSVAKKEAYRVCKSDEDLFKLLEKPYQSAYEDFSCIHLIPVGVDVSPAIGSNLQLINTPVENTYFFVFPQGVEEKDGKRYVHERETFSLVYKRNGYDDYLLEGQCVQFSSKYYKIEGKDTVKVYSAEDARIKFKKNITFYVSDGNRRPVDSFDIEIRNDGRILQTTGKNGQISISLEEGKYNYSIKASGYGKKGGAIDTKTNAQCDILLTSEEYEIEVYLIPAFEKKSKIENDRNETFTLGYKKHNLFYEKYSPDLHGKEVPTFYVTRERMLPRIIKLCVVSLLLGAVIGILMGHWMWPGKSESPKVETSSGSDAQEEGSQNVDSSSESTFESLSDEQHDENYLNQNNVWRYDSLRSEKYRNFYSVMVANNGINYKDVKWDDYSNITNTKWNEILSIIKESVSAGGWDKFNETRFSELKKEMNKEKKLDLNEAVKKKPNTTTTSRTSTTTTSSGKKGHRD